jgi:hypothetical protein
VPHKAHAAGVVQGPLEFVDCQTLSRRTRNLSCGKVRPDVRVRPMVPMVLVGKHDDDFRDIHQRLRSAKSASSLYATANYIHTTKKEPQQTQLDTPPCLARRPARREICLGSCPGAGCKTSA